MRRLRWLKDWKSSGPGPAAASKCTAGLGPRCPASRGPGGGESHRGKRLQRRRIQRALGLGAPAGLFSPCWALAVQAPTCLSHLPSCPFAWQQPHLPDAPVSPIFGKEKGGAQRRPGATASWGFEEKGAGQAETEELEEDRDWKAWEPLRHGQEEGQATRDRAQSPDGGRSREGRRPRDRRKKTSHTEGQCGRE